MTGIHYLNSIDLGKVNRWQNVKASTLTPISFPGEDANKTEAPDTLGIIAYYNISGRIVGGFETLQSTIYQIRAILDGSQTSASQLRSPFVNANFGASGTRIQGHLGSTTSVSSNELKDSTANFLSWGITTADYVKDLTTQNVYDIRDVAETSLLLEAGADPFTRIGMPYAVTASMNVKLLSFNCNWGLPGLNFVTYSMSVIQVL